MQFLYCGGVLRNQSGMAGMHLGTPPAGHAAMVVKWHVHILLKSFTILNTCSITMWQRCPSFMFILILSHHIRGCVSQPEGQYLNVAILSSGGSSVLLTLCTCTMISECCDIILRTPSDSLTQLVTFQGSSCMCVHTNH